MGRRWRYMPAALALLSATSASAQSASFSTKCWRVESASSQPTLAMAATDDACPVAVDVADLTAPFAPGDDVPALWTVTLKSSTDTSNALGMPLPPPPTALGNGVPPAQIAATFIRSCETLATCDPSSSAAMSSPVRVSNFSGTGEPLTFSALNALKYDREGDFPIAAIVAVRDAVDANVTYVFAAYSTVTIKTKAASTATRREGVVQCRMTRQSALNATLEATASVSASDQCELRVALAPLAVVRPNGSLPVAWVATLAPREDADIHLPSPLTAVQVEEDGTGNAYEIVASYVKLCKANASCDEYTPTESLAQVVAVGPASFSDQGNATFTSPPVTLATAGRQLAMLHMVVAGPARRYDFMYYFELLATEQNVAQEIASHVYAADTKTSYCWTVLADATSSNVTTASVAASASGSLCPYVSTLSLPSTSLTASTPFRLSWSLSRNANYSAYSSPLADLVNLSTVYDPTTKQMVSLPALHVYACGNGTACTPFSSDKTLLASLPARDLADDQATTLTADELVLPSEGNYTILVHSVFPNGASRVDTASMGAVSVARASTTVAGAATEKGKSHTTTYVLVSVACVVAVVAIVVGAVWLRRRRQRQRMDKMVQYGLFGAPANRGQGTVLHNTDSRGSFQSGDSGRGDFSFLHVQASQPSPVGIETPREGSLSYDPYQRLSFQDMSLQESNLSFAFTDNERPSVMTNDEDDRKGIDV